MSNTILTIVVFLFFIVAPCWLIYKMDKRASKKGALFTGQSTRGMKLLAIVLGVIFAGISIMEFFSSREIHIVFPVLAFALIGYGAGAGQLLGKLQGQGGNTESKEKSLNNTESAIGTLNQGEMGLIPQNRFTRFIKTFTIILIISAIFLYSAWLASTHPDNPLTWAFIIGVIVFIVLARVLDWFRFFRNLFK